MPPRPTPRQREVLEAMSDGTALTINHPPSGHGLLGPDGTVVRNATICTLERRGWIARSKWNRLYVITEAGRRAVARDDGGV